MRRLERHVAARGLWHLYAGALPGKDPGDGKSPGLFAKLSQFLECKPGRSAAIENLQGYMETWRLLQGCVDSAHAPLSHWRRCLFQSLAANGLSGNRNGKKYRRPPDTLCHNRA